MNQKSQDKLIRALGLGALTIYGVGDILGAGIYAIIGKIAGHAGSYAWLSFAIAMAVVSLTALSYSELGSRIPKSGGVSIYIQEAFGQKALSLLVGLLLFCATVLSMSTLSQAFAGYLLSLGFNFPKWLAIAAFFIILALINFRGIKQSSLANIISTMIEMSGLGIVIVCGLLYLSKSPHHTVIIPEKMPAIGDIIQGSVLAFFAFTGFEDLANVAEEVKNPEKNLPRALLTALCLAGTLYLLVSVISTAIIPGNELGNSNAPLLDVVGKSCPAIPNYVFAVIAIFAVFNTSLLNYITASRLLYGMSKASLMPKLFQTVHSKYHTPYIAILIIFPIVLILGLMGTLKGLANSTSSVVLVVFSFSCIALITIKIKDKNKQLSSKIFQIPMIIPCLAVILNLSAVVFIFYSHFQY